MTREDYLTRSTDLKLKFDCCAIDYRTFKEREYQLIKERMVSELVVEGFFITMPGHGKVEIDYLILKDKTK